VIFGRKQRSAGSAPAIVDFWAWWPTLQAAPPPPAELSRRIAAVHPDLEWELTPGNTARHALVVTAGGSADLRPVAARWGALAPPADPDWEFHTARQADPSALSAKLEFAGKTLDLSLLRLAFTRAGDRPSFDVVAHHPGFADLDDQSQGQVTFLALDWLLGEDGVEEWIDAVTWSRTPPPGHDDPAALATAVQRLRAEYRIPQWVLMRGTLPDGRPVLATAQRPLRSVRWPRFDTHVAITLPYRHKNADDLPEAESLTALREFEDTALTAAVGTDGELIAHETSRGARVLHYYVDGATPAAAALARAARGWKPGRARTESLPDPTFEHISHLR